MNFVLVHGAFRGGWYFDRLRPLLHRWGGTVAPDLLGMGSPAAEPAGELSLDDWSGQVVALVRSSGLDDVVLVGHSQGGLVVRAVGDELDGQVRMVAYLDAPVPEAGQRGVDLLDGPAPERAQLPPRATTLPPSPLEPSSELDPELVDWMNRRLGPTPFGPSLDPVHSSASSAPMVAAFCEDTPPWFPSAVSRREFDAVGRPYDLLPAGHDVPVTHPALVADWLGAHLGVD